MLFFLWLSNSLSFIKLEKAWQSNLWMHIKIEEINAESLISVFIKTLIKINDLCFNI